jgi:hypothetical protein
MKYDTWRAQKTACGYDASKEPTPSSSEIGARSMGVVNLLFSANASQIFDFT